MNQLIGFPNNLRPLLYLNAEIRRVAIKFFKINYFVIFENAGEILSLRNKPLIKAAGRHQTRQ
jgi:hypothetical protein